MNTIRTLLVGVLLSYIANTICTAQCNTNTFIDSVNSAWVSSNYPLLEQLLTNRVLECTNDLLAKGLLYEYYDNIIVDFYKARAAAGEFILAASNRMPSEVIHRRVPLELPMALVEMPIPTNFPPDQSKTQEQMDYLHEWYSNAFPHLQTFQELIGRIEAVESGRVTEDFFDPLNRD